MKFSLTMLAMLLASGIMAQNPAGNAFRVDYDEFQAGGGVKYFNCGNDDMLNVGGELTVMAWISFRDVNDNQKILGKFGLNNSGFLLGVDQGRIYPEAWNPTHHEALDGLMSPVDDYWYHLAMTFTAGDAMRTYINGEEVGEHTVTGADLATNDDPLIIGVSSWPNYDSFQSFGNMDEIMVYDVALTQEEIYAQIFRSHTGDEAGLVAGYTFNEASGETTLDITGNGNDCNGDNFSGSEFVPSMAVIADANTEVATDLNALWNGLTFTDPRFTTTVNGMNLLATGLDLEDYAVFGHNNMGGVSTDDIPTNAPAGFERTARIWATTAMGLPVADVLMALEPASDGGGMIDISQPAANYTLLWRGTGTSQFFPVAQGADFNNGVVTFEDIELWSGDYSIGVGSAPIEPSVVSDYITDGLTIAPNPTDGLMRISLRNGTGMNGSLQIIDMAGRIVLSEPAIGSTTNIDLAGLESGNYTLRLISSAGMYIQSIQKY